MEEIEVTKIKIPAKTIFKASAQGKVQYGTTEEKAREHLTEKLNQATEADVAFG